MKRIKTGIMGLDSSLAGGIPEASVVLLSGGPGSGKTIFCSQFLNNGAKNKEPGIYLTMEEDPKQLVSNMKQFGWNLNDPLIQISKLTLHNFDTLKKTIVSMVESRKVKRVVVDPITPLGLFFERKVEIRKSLVDLVSTLKELGVTTILSAEIPKGNVHEGSVSTYGVEEFVTDGVIVLHNIQREGNKQRVLEIVKMRGSKHEITLSPFEISDKGIVVYPDHQIF